MIVGIASGAVSAGYVELLRNATRVLGAQHWGRWSHLAVLGGVGVAIALLVRYLGNPGDVELLVDNIHVGDRPADVRALRSLIPVSLLGIAAGSAIGPEAPLVQTTGTIGSWVGHRLQLPAADRRILGITGMAAGFTVLFGAPLGGALFALEILHRRGLEYYEAMLPSALGALSGWIAYTALLRAGFRPVFEFPGLGSITFFDLALGVAAGVAGAGIATLFSWVIRAVRWAFARIDPRIRPVVGGLLLGGLAFASPYSLTFGEAQIDHIATTHLAVSVLLLAGACKLVAAATIVSSGWRGGFIIPLFFMGATVAVAVSHGIGGHEVVMLASMMVATNVGVTKTPIGSTAVVAEMAGMRILPPALIAAVVALFLTDGVSIIHTQRSRTAT